MIDCFKHATVPNNNSRLVGSMEKMELSPAEDSGEQQQGKQRGESLAR